MKKEQEKNQQEELLSLVDDRIFRLIFGQTNTDALADLLSAVFDISAEELGTLEIDDPNIRSGREGGKNSELDIRAHTRSGDILHVEVQVNPEPGFRQKRMPYYNGLLYTGQLKKGEPYTKLNRAVSVVIADHILFPENKDVHNRFVWYNEANGTLLTDMQEIRCLELEKLDETDDGTRLWNWLKFLKARRECEMEAIAKDSEAMRGVLATLRKLSADETERRLAEQRDKDERIKLSFYDGGLMEGEARGEARGIQIGEEERAKLARQLEQARRMLKEKGATDEEISAAIG